MGMMGMMGGMGGMGGGGLKNPASMLHQLPLVGSFFENPNEAFKQQQFQQAAGAYGAYRPEVAQARMNALRNSTSAFQGANDLLATMTGGKMSGVNPEQLHRNPMGPTMMTQGQNVAAQAPQGGGGLGALFGGMGGGMMPGMGGGLGGLFGGGM